MRSYGTHCARRPSAARVDRSVRPSRSTIVRPTSPGAGASSGRGIGQAIHAATAPTSATMHAAVPRTVDLVGLTRIRVTEKRRESKRRETPEGADAVRRRRQKAQTPEGADARRRRRQKAQTPEGADARRRVARRQPAVRRFALFGVSRCSAFASSGVCAVWHFAPFSFCP